MINVLEYLDETLKRIPDKIAFADEDTSLSFKELNVKLRAVGTYILKQEIQSEPVIVFMNKSVREIAAFLGVIAAGCYYVPIDAEMPVTRIQKIIDNCNPKLCITDETTYELAERFSFSGQIASYNEICNTEADDILLAETRAKALDIDPIYIVFTSGSTGIPKGVAACHRSVIDYGL